VAAGLDEIRGWLPIIRASSGLFVFFGLCQPRSDRSCHHVKEHLRSPWKLSLRGQVLWKQPREAAVIPLIGVSRLSGRTIGLTPAEHGPDDARKLVGHRRNHDVEGPSGDQASDPCPEAALTPSREPDQRSGAVHQLSAQIAVTALADAEQPFSATGRVLARGEAEPRGKAPAAGKDLRVDDRRHHRRGDH
jgi:hypothetical protein